MYGIWCCLLKVKTIKETKSAGPKSKKNEIKTVF